MSRCHIMIHHVTSVRNSHQRLGRIKQVTASSSSLDSWVQSMSKVCPGEFGSLEALVPRLIELLKKSRPMLLQSLESTPQCCYMGVSIHGGTPLAGWCMMKKDFEIGDLGVHPFMGSPHMHAMHRYAMCCRRLSVTTLSPKALYCYPA